MTNAGRIKQVVTFGAISVLTTLIDFGVFNLLIAGDRLPTIAANTIGYATGILASYVLNKQLTFSGGGHDSRTREFTLFVAINIVGLLLNNAAVGGAEAVLSDSPVVLNAAKLAAGVVTWVLKFGAFERWVYPERAPVQGTERS